MDQKQDSEKNPEQTHDLERNQDPDQTHDPERSSSKSTNRIKAGFSSAGLKVRVQDMVQCVNVAAWSFCG